MGWLKAIGLNVYEEPLVNKIISAVNSFNKLLIKDKKPKFYLTKETLNKIILEDKKEQDNSSSWVSLLEIKKVNNHIKYNLCFYDCVLVKNTTLPGEVRLGYKGRSHKSKNIKIEEVIKRTISNSILELEL